MGLPDGRDITDDSPYSKSSHKTSAYISVQIKSQLYQISTHTVNALSLLGHGNRMRIIHLVILAKAVMTRGLAD